MAIAVLVITPFSSEENLEKNGQNYISGAEFKLGVPYYRSQT